MNTTQPIPMYLALQYGGQHHDDDTVEHEVCFRIGNAADSATLAIVQSDAYADPRVLRYPKRGDFSLPPSLLDKIVILGFKRAAKAMLSLDGSSVQMIVDARPWLARRLPLPESPIAIKELNRFVRGAEFEEDFCWVMMD